MKINIISKYLEKQFKQNNISSPIVKNGVSVVLLFNLSKYKIEDKNEIKKAISNLNLKPFWKVSYSSKVNYDEINNLVKIFCKQFANANEVNKVFNEYLELFKAKQEVIQFEYFYNMENVNKNIEIKKSNMLSNYLKQVSIFNNLVTDLLKFNYSPIIEYARDSLIKGVR